MTNHTSAHWRITRADTSYKPWTVWHMRTSDDEDARVHNIRVRESKAEGLFWTFEEAAAACERWYLAECAKCVRENEATTTERSTEA